MTNRLLPLFVVIIIVLTSVFFARKIATQEDELDAMEGFVTTMKTVVDENANLSLFNLEDHINDVKMFAWMRYAVAPRHLTPSIQSDTILCITKDSSTAKQMEPAINKSRKILWQERHQKYNIVLTCSKDAPKQ